MQETAGAEAAVSVDGYALAAFGGYLLILVTIGVGSSRFSSRGVGEFFVGGRRMNRLVVALSAVVSGRSAWLLLGVTGMAFSTGASALWAVTGYTVVELVLFFTLARRLRRFAEGWDCVTLPDFFAARFGDEDGRLRMTIAGVILLFMVGYVASQFTGGGKAIGASFGLSAGTGVLLTAVIVLGYTVLGGFLAVSLTDSLQAVFMLFGLVAVPALAIADAGGWGPSWPSSPPGIPPSPTPWRWASAPGWVSWASASDPRATPTSSSATCPSTTSASSASRASWVPSGTW